MTLFTENKQKCYPYFYAHMLTESASPVLPRSKEVINVTKRQLIVSNVIYIRLLCFNFFTVDYIHLRSIELPNSSIFISCMYTLILEFSDFP